jgi:hypothetical protein
MSRAALAAAPEFNRSSELQKLLEIIEAAVPTGPNSL